MTQQLHQCVKYTQERFEQFKLMPRRPFSPRVLVRVCGMRMVNLEILFQRLMILIRSRCALGQYSNRFHLGEPNDLVVFYEKQHCDVHVAQTILR